MDKKTTLSYAGSMQQLAHVRPIVFQEGRAAGMHAYHVKNGLLQFLVMADKCMDIGEFSYRGMNLNFLSKPGLMGRNHFDTNGEEALRSIMGGLMFTCGFENICVPCTAAGRQYPMHGRIRTTPAEHVCADARWHNDEEYVITLNGEMREAELFGENLVLRRQIRTVFSEPSIEIIDQVSNESFREEPLLLLYHFNIGYPLLTEHAQVILPSKKVVPRDEAAAKHIADWSKMEKPEAGIPEQVFIHELAADKEGDTFAAIINESLNLGIMLEFNKKYLPYFMQWKSPASGDYVVGLEPANSSVYGRAFHEKEDTVHKLPPFEKECIRLKITVLDGEKAIQAAKKKVSCLL